MMRNLVLDTRGRTVEALGTLKNNSRDRNRKQARGDDRVPSRTQALGNLRDGHQAPSVVPKFENFEQHLNQDPVSGK